MTYWPIILVGGLVLLVVAYFAMRYIKSLEQRDHVRSLLGQRYSDEEQDRREGDDAMDSSESEAQQAVLFNKAQRKQGGRRKGPSLDEKMFQAGMFAEEQRRDYRRMQIVLPSVLGFFGGIYGGWSGDPLNILVYAMIGVMLGSYIMVKRLEKAIALRQEDVLFFLPLVVEQISIGVSSSLDIGPCLARVVQMADERDSHNPVTELLRFAQAYIKSGVSLQDALVEVGRQSGSNEVKHAFKALAQVARYGGEISKQLQDLSETVSSERETRIQEKIKKLELAATAPVALVFGGFLFILLIGFGITLMKAME